MARNKKKPGLASGGGIIPVDKDGKYIPGPGEESVKPPKGPTAPDGPTVDGEPLYEIPYGSYDPSIGAQRRAAERGLKDLKFDTKVANNWSKKDLNQSLNDIKRSWGRGKTDIKRDRKRGHQKLKFRSQDLKLDAGRAREDFGSRLADIGRQFGNLASSQQESRNAAGTLTGGTAAAAAAKRSTNQALAVQPIATAAGRMEQDLATNLSRIGTSRAQLNTDSKIALNRGQVDVNRDRKLTKIDSSRGKFDRFHKLQRGIREQKVGDSDLMQQAIYSARSTNPGVFGKYGKKKNKKKGM